MKFSSIEQFLKHIFMNDINITDVDFTFNDVGVDLVNGGCSIDSGGEPIIDSGCELKKLNAKVGASSMESLEFLVGDKNILVVEDYTAFDGAMCGSGMVQIGETCLVLNICSDSELNHKVSIPVTINGITESVDFILTKYNDKDTIRSTISHATQESYFNN